jgi:energy-coupling factor transporter transmembrane protein EcfT
LLVIRATASSRLTPALYILLRVLLLLLMLLPWLLWRVRLLLLLLLAWILTVPRLWLLLLLILVLILVLVLVLVVAAKDVEQLLDDPDPVGHRAEGHHVTQAGEATRGWLDAAKVIRDHRSFKFSQRCFGSLVAVGAPGTDISGVGCASI